MRRLARPSASAINPRKARISPTPATTRAGTEEIRSHHASKPAARTRITPTRGTGNADRKKRRPGLSPGAEVRACPVLKAYFSALSVMSWVQAMPSGFLVMAGFSAEIAANSVATVSS